MAKKNKNVRKWIFNFWLGEFHWSPKCIDHINNQGKVADVMTDALDNDSEVSEATIANKKASSWSEGKESERARANLSQPVPKAILKMKREIWREFPIEKPSSKPGKGIHAPPGGLIIQLNSSVDKFVRLGEKSMLGAIDTPSIHCLLDNICWTMSSPMEQGVLIRDILKRITKTKKTLRGERFFRPSLKGI